MTTGLIFHNLINLRSVAQPKIGTENTVQAIPVLFAMQATPFLESNESHACVQWCLHGIKVKNHSLKTGVRSATSKLIGLRTDDV